MIIRTGMPALLPTHHQRVIPSASTNDFADPLPVRVLVGNAAVGLPVIDQRDRVDARGGQPCRDALLGGSIGQVEHELIKPADTLPVRTASRRRFSCLRCQSWEPGQCHGHERSRSLVPGVSAAYISSGHALRSGSSWAQPTKGHRRCPGPVEHVWVQLR